MLSVTATICLFVLVILFALISVVLLAVVAFSLNKIGGQVEKLTNMAEPVVTKASNTLDTVQRVTMNVGEKADNILTRGETLTENVSANVEKTANVVQHTVTTPLIKVSSMLAGVTKGFSVYASNGKSHRSNDSKE